MPQRLAIVIPVYKPDYLALTLDSLVHQTCKDFNVYIGDDNSPFDLYSIVRTFLNKLNITYTKFPVNFGGHDLVSQWKRCIDLSNDENWIWLFSDDDIMGPRCVELFYDKLRDNHAERDIYHFDISVINEDGRVIRVNKRFPRVISSEYLYQNKESAKLESFVVEYIFSRDIYNRKGGFVNFDLAWGSDMATWLKFGYEKGIETIGGDDVFWRSSNVNITPNLNNEIVLRKFKSSIEYIKWANSFFKNRSIAFFNYFYLFRISVFYSLSLTFSNYRDLLCKAKEVEIINSFSFFVFCFLFPFMKIGKRIKSVICR